MILSTFKAATLVLNQISFNYRMLILRGFTYYKLGIAGNSYIQQNVFD